GYNVFRTCDGGARARTEADCPGGWERISGSSPILDNRFLDRDVNKARRASPDGHGYNWSYMVTAVLEWADGSRVETQANGTVNIDVYWCLADPGAAHYGWDCEKTAYPNFPMGGLAGC
ncbi:MAG: hypothetical protein ACREJ4_01810, partial [Candidatus Methylomirabilaceae bacterium]